MKDNSQPQFFVARQVVLKPMSDTPVFVTTILAGLMMIAGNTNVFKHRLSLTALGVVDVIPNVPFYILVPNFSDRLAQLPKHFLVAAGKDPPQFVLHFARDDQLGEALNPEKKEKEGAGGDEESQKINPVHYKPAENLVIHIDRHQAVQEE